MKPAISTACFYPLETMESLRLLLTSGVKDIEIFFNTDSEIEIDSLKTIKKITEEFGCNICAIHPFYSVYDWFYFFSDYKARILDGVKLYRKLFTAAEFLNAPIVSFHGEHKNSTLDRLEGYNTLKMLYDVAAEYGVTLCQENVSRNRICTAEEITALRQTFNDDIAFTIDIKQARRSEQSPLDMIKAAGPCLKHLHLSSKTKENDCVLPTDSDPEVKRIIAYLNEIGYNGYIVIELYRNGFVDIEDLMSSYNMFLQHLSD